MHWCIFQFVIILKNGEDTAEDEEDDDCEEDEQGIEGLTLTTQTAQTWLVALNVYIWKMENEKWLLWTHRVTQKNHQKSVSGQTTWWVPSMKWSDEHGRLSPPLDNAVNDDDQGKDEHECPKTDGDELLQFSRTASVISEDEAAFAAERGWAAADHTGKNLVSAFQRWTWTNTHT